MSPLCNRDFLEYHFPNAHSTLFWQETVHAGAGQGTCGWARGGGMPIPDDGDLVKRVVEV